MKLSYDLNGYLTSATMEFCHEKIRAMGCDPDTLNASDVEEYGTPQQQPKHLHTQQVASIYIDVDRCSKTVTLWQ